VTTPADICAYCGAPATTDDHIPPQGLLIGVPRRMRPSVRACADCNGGASDDDEYFRDVVLKYHRVADKPEAQPAIERMFRAMKKPEKRGYAADAILRLTEANVRTFGGIHLGRQPAYHVDGERIERTAQRYVRGLHQYERGMAIAASHRLRVSCEPESLTDRVRRIAESFRAARVRVVRKGVFWYSYFAATDAPESSAWLLVFFDSFPILGVILPRERSIPGAG